MLFLPFSAVVLLFFYGNRDAYYFTICCNLARPCIRALKFERIKSISKTRVRALLKNIGKNHKCFKYFKFRGPFFLFYITRFSQRFVATIERIEENLFDIYISRSRSTDDLSNAIPRRVNVCLRSRIDFPLPQFNSTLSRGYT